jgi:cephalosporin-C deacetylase-like acetyl esterase
MRIQTKKVWTQLTMVILFNSMAAFAQETLDVLPVEGRNALFHEYLMEELDSLVAIRKLGLDEALTSVEKLQAKQVQLKEDYLKLLGTLPAKTPLNAVVVDTIMADGYTIEKVYYESRPHHRVTANLYIPAKGAGPFPAILIAMGHYGDGKASQILQSECIFLARQGFVVLIVDFIGYVERDQIVDPSTGSLALTGESGTTEHSLMDVGSVITGSSVVAHILWDNYRGIDYLCTRPEVDTSRIGCTGSSGGGAQATYLVAFDGRIKVTVIDSYIMDEQTLFSTIGPQTASQNLSYEGVYGIDHGDYITMFAPKPFLITASTQDFFDINATRQAYADAQIVYEKLGAQEKIGFFETNTSHGLNGPKREATVKWFRTWFYGDTTTLAEPAYTFRPRDSLQVTETGQVYTSFDNEVTVTDLNIAAAESYEPARESFWSENTKDSCLNMVKSLIRLDQKVPDPVPESVEMIDRGQYTIEKIKISAGNHCPVTGLLFAPKNDAAKLPAVLYVDGRGKKTDAEAMGLIEQVYIDSGKIVFAVDVRGFGETADNPGYNDDKYKNKEHRNAVISLYIGKTLIGQRVEDIRMAMDYLISRADVNPDEISIVGIDRAGIAVLHAAALDARYSEVVVRNTDSSWMDIIEKPLVPNNMTHTVPSAMQYYDLPDLVKAIAPRPVYYNPPDYIVTDIHKITGDIAGQWVLEQNHPNPFLHKTLIPYSLAEPAHVRLVIYDGQGKEVETLVNEMQDTADYSVVFDASTHGPGIYFCQLFLNGKRVESKKMIVY